MALGIHGAPPYLGFGCLCPPWVSAVPPRGPGGWRRPARCLAARQRLSPGSTAEPGAWSELERCRRRRRRCRYCRRRRRCSLCISRSLPLPFLPSALPPRVRPPSSSARRPRPPRARPSAPGPRPTSSFCAPLPGGPQLLSSCSPCVPRRPVIQRPPRHHTLTVTPTLCYPHPDPSPPVLCLACLPNSFC